MEVESQMNIYPRYFLLPETARPSLYVRMDGPEQGEIINIHGGGTSYYGTITCCHRGIRDFGWKEITEADAHNMLAEIMA